MKLWEIKAQSLRQMFTDTDLSFSYDDFVDGVVYANSNTKEKLTRMNDSISRAIDVYYSYVGERQEIKEFNLSKNESQTSYINEISCSSVSDFSFPSRVDILYYLDPNDKSTLRFTKNQVEFVFLDISKTITFINNDYTEYGANAVFRVWYKVKKQNLPLSVDEMSYDLNTIYIPEEVQRMIPYFVKGELYEEDEPTLAQTAKNQYIRFVNGLRKPFSQAQTKVQSSRLFKK
jgi:hypothetical protein